MEHFYQNLEGMFSFHNIYHEVVKHINIIEGQKPKFIEVGAWKGKSACFMAVEIINSGKDIDFFVIDPFPTLEELHELYGDIHPIEDALYKTYLENIEPVKHIIKTIRKPSLEAVENFQDHSIDFIFLDGDHTYEYVKKELAAWYPKLKKGGIFAGHDYMEPTCGVKKAVDEFFGEENVVAQSDWSFVYFNE